MHPKSRGLNFFRLGVESSMKKNPWSRSASISHVISSSSSFVSTYSFNLHDADFAYNWCDTIKTSIRISLDASLNFSRMNSQSLKNLQQNKLKRSFVSFTELSSLKRVDLDFLFLIEMIKMWEFKSLVRLTTFWFFASFQSINFWVNEIVLWIMNEII